MQPRSTLTKRKRESGITLEQILVPVDLSMQSRGAVKYAAGLAAAFDASLHLLSAVEPFPFMSGVEQMPELYLSDAEVISSVQDSLRALAEKEVPASQLESLVVRTGKPVPVILRAATKLSVSLIVLSSHGRSGLKRLLLGSTAEQVIRLAPCPVLVLRQRMLGRWQRQQRDPFMGVRNIMVPTDFSEPSLEALRYAIDFADRLNSRVLVLCVVPPITGGPYLMGNGVDATRKSALRSAHEAMSNLARRELPRGAMTRVASGVPFDQITRVAKEVNSDMIIMGTQGRTGLKRALLGSTAENVVRHAPCPVLVVRPQKSERMSRRITNARSRAMLHSR
jgi:nucleotide-binding universal stress UspA family protein